MRGLSAIEADDLMTRIDLDAEGGVKRFIPIPKEPELPPEPHWMREIRICAGRMPVATEAVLETLKAKKKDTQENEDDVVEENNVDAAEPEDVVAPAKHGGQLDRGSTETAIRKHHIHAMPPETGVTEYKNCLVMRPSSVPVTSKAVNGLSGAGLAGGGGSITGDPLVLTGETGPLRPRLDAAEKYRLNDRVTAQKSFKKRQEQSSRQQFVQKLLASKKNFNIPTRRHS